MDQALSYANMTATEFTRRNPLREQWQRANLDRNLSYTTLRPLIDQNNPENEKQRKRKKMENTIASQTTDRRNKIISDHAEPSTSGSALINTHTVSERERLENQRQRAADHTVQEAIMLFYSDFIDMLGTNEAIKEKFKNCTKRHFNLAEAVINNKP